ncbi:DUF1642 domain-containing protein [Streptococcus sp. V919]
MNKQELIEKIEALPDNIGLIRPHIDKKIVLGLVRQLDEPQKVKVSEEEAKFLETFDFNCESDVTTALYHVSRTGWGYYLRDNDGIELKDLSEGFRELENRKRLIKAILDGYEVGKEKRYLVTIKGVMSNFRVLKHNINEDTWYMSNKINYTDLKAYHTKKELEDAGFGEVFDSSLFEVEEVEDE